MTLEPHPHIKFTTSEIQFLPNGDLLPVAVVYTDLQLNDLHPNYDAEAVAVLLNHIRDFMKENNRTHIVLKTITV